MEEKSGSENRKINTGSDVYLDNKKNPHVEPKLPQRAFLTWGSDSPPISPIKISGHSLLWKWLILEGHAQRGQFKRVQLRGWEKRIWSMEAGIIPKNVKIVQNLEKLEVWVKSKPKENSDRMIFKAALTAMETAQKFANWQKLILKLEKSDHPEDIQRGHFVLEDKKLIVHLNEQVGKAPLIGLTRDKTPDPAGLPELTGKYSAEGAIGFDWVCLELQEEIKRLRESQTLVLQGITQLMKKH